MTKTLLALGIGDASRVKRQRPDLVHEGSEHSEERQLALGLESLKFARAIGEGETPSSREHTSDRSADDTEASPFFPPGPTEQALYNVMAQRENVSHSKRLSRPMSGERSSTPMQGVSSKSEVQTISDPVNRSQTHEVEDGVEDEDDDPSMSTSVPAPSLNGPTRSAPDPLQSLISVNGSRVGKGLRVLVVDDDTITRTLMSRLLSRLGCIVTTAENGKVGLEKILNGNIPPEIILGDRRTGMGMSTGLPAHQCPDDKEHVYMFDIVFLDNQMVSKRSYHLRPYVC